ncbi:MAG: sulfatase [Gemmatimonadota bacterium]
MTRARASGTPGRDAGRILLVATFFALLTAAIEAVSSGFRFLVLHEIQWVSRDIAWIAPLGYLLFFLPPAVLLIAVSLVLRRPIPFRWTVALFAFLCVFAILLPIVQIPWWISAAVAALIGVRFGNVVAPAAGQWLRRFGLGAAALGGLAVLTGLGIRVSAMLQERTALAEASALGLDTPNVLLLVLDTVRRASSSLYGYPRATTPALAALAREGVAFDRAVVTAPWSLASHGSIFTGRSAGGVGADWRRPIPAAPRRVTEVLRARGYVTGGFVSNLLYASYESGLARGFVHYDDYPFTFAVVVLHTSFGCTTLFNQLREARSRRAALKALRRFNLKPARVAADVLRPATEVTDHFLAWQARIGQRPFFAFINYVDAHEPYEAPEPFRSRFVSPPGSTPAPIDRYDGAIAYVDHELGRIVASLRQRGVLERTMLIVLSDHGEGFGEHGLHGHANSLYLPVVEVPLVIRYPASVPAGRHVKTLVTLRDVPATMLDLAGVRRAADIGGTSLARYWTSSEAADTAVALIELVQGINVDSSWQNSRGPATSIMDQRFHYIRDGLGREELYAYTRDSLELDNLVSEPEAQADLGRLRQRLAEAMAQEGAVAGVAGRSPPICAIAIPFVYSPCDAGAPAR